MLVLIVEDDERLARNLAESLQKAGFAVEHERNGHEAWVKGEPTPFLPGPARYTLRLEPANR